MPDEPGNPEPTALAAPTEADADADADADVHDVRAPRHDDLDDMSVTIGRVVSIRGSVVWGALFDDDDGTAARAARMGALVSMRGPDSRVFGIVNALKRDGAGGGPQAERTIFEIQVLGEISTVSPGARAAGFQRGVSSYPPLDAPVTTVTLRDLAAVYARPRVSNVHVGRLRHNHKVPAFVLTDSLLGKHFAVLGTTGSGKSCAVIGDPALDPGRVAQRPHRAARPAQRVRQRLRRSRRAPQSLESAAAVLAAELRGDRPHPDRRHRATSTASPRPRSSRTRSCAPSAPSSASRAATTRSPSTRRCRTACRT